jgi:hypothetical protein
LLAQWERYIDKHIEVVREAKGVTFVIKEQVWSPADVVALIESNRPNAIRELKFPEIRDRDQKKRYDAIWINVKLFSLPVPRRESFPDQAQFSKATELWALGRNWVIETNGYRFPSVGEWVKLKAGEPPPMPKLKKKRTS